ncbi:MAG: alpha/beta hydrolase [bacterium]|nr:alpha/beta hydrolase [bacterium]
MKQMKRYVILCLLLTAAVFSVSYSETASNLYDIDYKTNSFIVKRDIINTVKLNYRKWYNEDSRAVIIYLSGMQSHSQWFNDTGDYLSGQGYNVYALDRRGSGLSNGSKGDIASYLTWINDLHEFVQFVEKENPDLPVHLMANCFGTRIILGYSILHPCFVDSLILFAPAMHMNVDLNSQEKFLVATHFFTRINTPLKDEYFTSNPEKLEFMEQDDLAVRNATARLYREGELLKTFVQISKGLINTPALVLLSMDDVVIKPQKVIDDFYNQLPGQKKLVTFEDVDHFLLFEPSREEALLEVSDWVDSIEID